MKLIPENDNLLRQVCAEYDFQSETLEERHDRVQQMIDLMALSHGVGLAAPQIGLLQRFFIIEAHGSRFPCYNPSIVESSSETDLDYEGCLSFPDLFFKVPRSVSILGKFQDIEGKWMTRRFDGLAARCYQHELDHLNGVCFTDKVGPVALSMAQKRRLKQRKAKK